MNKADNLQMAPVSDNADWTGEALASSIGWRYVLNASEIRDLRKMAAVVRVLIDNDPNKLLSLPENQFHLGVFAPRSDQIFQELKSGNGIALIKGLPIDELEPLDTAIIYWAIGLKLGQATPNNPEGDMFGHITDLGKTQKDANSRGYQTREAMDYHCDQCDIVGLLCLRKAKSGGESKVASSIAMYNEMVRTYPEHAEVLTKPLCWSKMGEYADGEQPYYQSPVFNFFDSQLCVSFGPIHIIKGHNLDETPALSSLQREAIRIAEDIADEQRYDMVLDRGDMQFLNNYVALHTRSAYEDYEEPERKRLLWRLWLMNSDLRARTDYARNFQNGVKLGNQRAQIRL